MTKGLEYHSTSSTALSSQSTTVLGVWVFCWSQVYDEHRMLKVYVCFVTGGIRANNMTQKKYFSKTLPSHPYPLSFRLDMVTVLFCSQRLESSAGDLHKVGPEPPCRYVLAAVESGRHFHPWFSCLLVVPVPRPDSYK